MDTGVQLGRRFRALKLWMVLRSFGAEGLRARLARAHAGWRSEFASWVDADPRFERRRAGAVQRRLLPLRGPRTVADEAALDALNERLLDAVNASGEVFLSHTKLGGRYVLRLAIGNLRTTEAARAARLGAAARARGSVVRARFLILPAMTAA